MLKPSFTRQFERDLKLMQKRGKNPQKFKTVAELLIGGQLLSERYTRYSSFYSKILPIASGVQEELLHLASGVQ